MLKTIISIFAFLQAVVQATDFNGDSAKAYLDKLCYREFAGRKSGEVSAKLAEAWVAEKFREFGLQPGGNEGYFQTFPILSNTEISASLELMNGYHGRKRYIHSEDFHLITNSGSGKVIAEVVFVGYGIYEPEKGRDDYQGVDIKGKIALIVKDTPHPARKWDKESSREYKLKVAVEKGAKAVMFLNDAYPISGAAIPQASFYQNIPVLYIAEHIAVDIFRGSGEDLDHLKNILKNKSHSFLTGRFLKITTKLKYNPNATASNVIGIIPGSSAKWCNEWVIVGAHLDHNGVNAVGDVFYGADDNASGASILMELARNFAILNPASMRSMMFIAFAGEEQGLLGSEYFVNNSLIPLDSIAGMFNFDCCGIGQGNVGFGGAEHFPYIWHDYKLNKEDEYLSKIDLGMIWGRGSDNHSFQEVGIPTFNYWSTGKRAFYHQVEDAPDRISFLALNNVGGYAFDFIQYFANWDQQLIWPNQKEQTLMYSSAQINLNDFYIPPVWEEECLATEVFHSMALGPTKATLVQINSNCPYKDIAYWRDFCSRNGFIWGKNADDVKNAMRRKQFALIPALGFFQNPQTKVEDLPNLFDLGVKFIYIENEEVSNPALIELIKPANDLQMVFIYMNDDSIRSILPAQSRQVIIIDEVEEVLPEISPEDADNVRIALRDINYALKPVKGKNYEQIIYLDYLEYKDSDMQKTLHRLGLLQEAGFQRADLKYILGETILELMPK